MSRELEISKFQKKYRDQANIQSISNGQKDKRQKLEKHIERLAREIENLNKTLTVVQSKVNRQRTDKFIQHLEEVVIDIKRHNKLIYCAKMTVHQLKGQIIRADCDHVRCERQSISDHEYAAKLAKARKTVTILETQLDAGRKKENKLKGHNSQLLIVIRDAIIGRAIFNRMWTSMVDRLNFDRKMVISMVDRVLLAYSFGKQICYQIDLVRKKEKNEKEALIGKMGDVMKAMEQDAIAVSFFQQKARVIPYKDLDGKETVRRAQFKQIHATKTAQSKKARSDINQFVNEHRTKAVIEKYIRNKRQYFAYCLYLNDIENKITCNSKSLADMQQNIDGGRRDAETLSQKLNRIEKLKSRLLDEQYEAQQREQQLAAADKILLDSFEKINSIFRALECDVNSIGLVIDFENDRANETNYTTYLSAMDARIKQIISFVYHCERDETDEWWKDDSMTVKDVEVSNCNTIDSPHKVIVPQCAECAEAEDLARPDIDKPLDRNEIREFIRTTLPKTDLHNRVHHIEKCPRPSSRALLAKLVWPDDPDGNFWGHL